MKAIEEMERILQEEPDSLVAYWCVLAAFASAYKYTEDDHIFWDYQARAWAIYCVATETDTAIEFHGVTKKNQLHFRMFNTLYRHRGWHTVLLPVNFEITEEEWPSQQ